MQRPRQSQFCVSYRIFCFLCTSNIEHSLADGQRLYIAGFRLPWPASLGARLGSRLLGSLSLSLSLRLCCICSIGFCPSSLRGRFLPILRRVVQTKPFNKVREICTPFHEKNYYNTNIEYIGRISYSNIVQHRPYHITSQKIVLLMAYGHLCLVCS